MSDTAAVLAEAKAAGLELFPEGDGNLRNRGTLPQALREKLVRHKAEILQLLSIASDSPTAPDLLSLPSDLESTLVRIEWQARTLTKEPRLLEAVDNLLADVRDFWREGKHGTATNLARHYSRTIPAYLALQARPIKITPTTPSIA